MCVHVHFLCLATNIVVTKGARWGRVCGVREVLRMGGNILGNTEYHGG
jgi:hypothetical protein